MNPNEAHLLVDIRDGVAMLTMNRPERLNALSQDDDRPRDRHARALRRRPGGRLHRAHRRRAGFLRRRRRQGHGRRAEQRPDPGAAGRPAAAIHRLPACCTPAQGQHRSDQRPLCRRRLGPGAGLRPAPGGRQRQVHHRLCQGRIYRRLRHHLAAGAHPRRGPGQGAAVPVGCADGAAGSGPGPAEPRAAGRRADAGGACNWPRASRRARRWPTAT